MERPRNGPVTNVIEHGPRVVLVEDDESTRTAIRGLLELGGYEVREEANGRDGLIAIREVHPDVVVTDIIMPVLDGRALARSLRSDNATCDIPIVAATGERFQPDLRDSRLFAAVLHKPFNASELLTTVDRVRASQRTWSTKP